MATTDKPIVTGLFKDRADAEAAYQAAIRQGYKPDDINIIMSEDTRTKYFNNENVKVELGDKSMEGLAVGGSIGGTIGGIVGAIAAIGTSLVIPGLGIVVAGPLAAGWAGAGAGSITGGLIGTLVGLGIPEERVKEYEDGINSGGILMGVHGRSDSDSKLLADEWDRYHSKQTKY